MSSLQNTVFLRNEINFHLIPGRLRIGVPGLLNNESYAGFLAHRLAKFPGVRLSYANPTTGQLLLNFDHQKTDLSLLLSWVYKISGKDRGAKGGVSLSGKTAEEQFPVEQMKIGTISENPPYLGMLWIAQRPLNYSKAPLIGVYLVTQPEKDW